MTWGDLRAALPATCFGIEICARDGVVAWEAGSATKLREVSNVILGSPHGSFELDRTGGGEIRARFQTWLACDELTHEQGHSLPAELREALQRTSFAWRDSFRAHTETLAERAPTAFTRAAERTGLTIVEQAAAGPDAAFVRVRADSRQFARFLHEVELALEDAEVLVRGALGDDSGRVDVSRLNFAETCHTLVNALAASFQPDDPIVATKATQLAREAEAGLAKLLGSGLPDFEHARGLGLAYFAQLHPLWLSVQWQPRPTLRGAIWAARDAACNLMRTEPRHMRYPSRPGWRTTEFVPRDSLGNPVPRYTRRRPLVRLVPDLGPRVRGPSRPRNAAPSNSWPSCRSGPAKTPSPARAHELSA